MQRLLEIKNNRRHSTRHFLMTACLLTIFMRAKFIGQTTVKILTAYATFHCADFTLNLLFPYLTAFFTHFEDPVLIPRGVIPRWSEPVL